MVNNTSLREISKLNNKTVVQVRYHIKHPPGVITTHALEIRLFLLHGNGYV